MKLKVTKTGKRIIVLTEREWLLLDLCTAAFISNFGNSRDYEDGLRFVRELRTRAWKSEGRREATKE